MWSTGPRGDARRTPQPRRSDAREVAMKIYLSSTYTDLLGCREAVYKVLRMMRHDVIAMEDYGATDRRPLDKCLDDVARTDLYLGIFAWRYGYVPERDN